MKHMKLIALLAAALIVQQAHAGKKVDAAKKTGRVVWHAGQVVVSGSLCVVGAMTWWPWQKEFLRNNGKRDWGKWNDKVSDDFIAIVVVAVGVPTTFSAGIRGLNHELKISERAKKLADRIRKRKVSAA